MSEFGSQPPSYGATPPANQPSAAVEYAGMGRRFAARVIDTLLLMLLGGILGAVFFGGAATQVEVDPTTGQVTQGSEGLIAAYFGWVLLFSAIALAYELVLIALRGATLGKQILGVKVVREDNGQVPGWVPSLLRWLIPFAGSFFCGIGQLVVYLSPFWDSTNRRQGWHDKVAKTLVVRV